MMLATTPQFRRPAASTRRFKPASKHRTLVPLQLVNHEDHHQTHPSAEHIECPTCQKTFLGSSVVTDSPVLCENAGQHKVVRRLYCDHCNHVVCWEQASNASGSRLGLVLSEPGILRTRAVIFAFLNAHPEAAGVLQR